MTATNQVSHGSQRLLSIDVLRGVTVAFMILVNNNGRDDLAYRALNHSPWNGFTPTDLVFPTFLFIMGISLVLSLSGKLDRGATRASIFLHALRRFALLIFWGLVVNGFPYFHLSTLRIYGVLQRFAVCYILGVLLLSVTRKVSVMAGLTIAILIGYWVLLRWVPVPGHGLPVRDFPLLDHDINLTAWIDRQVFPGRLFEGTRDPEGLLSDLPSFASVVLGMIAAFWLRSIRSPQAKVLGFLFAAIVLLAGGLIWDVSFPINKRLWTSSYVLFAGGWSLLGLGASYYLFDIRKVSARWITPALVLGMNAISAYVLSELLSSGIAAIRISPVDSLQQRIYFTLFHPVVNPAFGSLIYSICFVFVCWIPMYVLYRKKVFLKL
ncbi:putative acyltransferase [Granulicella aggregans]|uniref:Putative acyltransferase n=1 Tax=Granulicella aggregans TaxID=474949 RepID=A0A7W7ZG06_9BACT|nr:heparan-alpha-glucosaminide N-acetyltransferase domain-containing protein [Granulicella aggregans]MBB5059121.1 putative acyltransferase [Granulicella aggregans]